MSQRLLNSKKLRIIGMVGGEQIHEFGGSERDDTDGSSDGTGSKDDSKKRSDSSKDDEDDDHDEDDEDDEEPKAKRSKDLDAYKARKRARLAEQDRDTLRAELDELKNGKKGDLEATQDRMAKAEDRTVKLEAVLAKNLLETAILKDPKYTFHDVDVIVATMDREGIDIDLELGTVEGLREVLDTIATDKPFLVKSTNTKRKVPVKKDDESDGEEKNGSSGGNVGGGTGTDVPKNLQRDALEKKYKILRR